tara:strand:+ start:336 stop:566 length:231 start_codon:yes stop_codon:yes gene_type:complete
MRVAKLYIAKVEKTIYSIDTIEIVAEREGDALELLREGEGKIVNTTIQEETVDNRWIDSSEPLSNSEFFEFEDRNG